MKKFYVILLLVLSLSMIGSENLWAQDCTSATTLLETAQLNLNEAQDKFNLAKADLDICTATVLARIEECGPMPCSNDEQARTGDGSCSTGKICRYYGTGTHPLYPSYQGCACTPGSRSTDTTGDTITDKTEDTTLVGLDHLCCVSDNNNGCTDAFVEGDPECNRPTACRNDAVPIGGNCEFVVRSDPGDENTLREVCKCMPPPD